MTDLSSNERVVKAANTLKALVRDAMPGCCRMLSLGDECECHLCLIDFLAHEATSLQSLVRVKDKDYQTLRAAYEGRSQVETKACQRMHCAHGFHFDETCPQCEAEPSVNKLELTARCPRCGQGIAYLVKAHECQPCAVCDGKGEYWTTNTKDPPQLVRCENCNAEKTSMNPGASMQVGGRAEYAHVGGPFPNQYDNAEKAPESRSVQRRIRNCELQSQGSDLHE